MKITRIYPDEQGESHFAELDIPLKPGGEIGALSERYAATGLIFRETPPSYDYDWHNAPDRQFIIMLAGDGVEVTVSDGEVRQFWPGDVVLVEDTWGKGHISRAIKGETRLSIFVLLDESTAV